MYINELLELRGLDPKAKVKMVRHQNHRLDVDELMYSGLIEFYQAWHSFNSDQVQWY